MAYNNGIITAPVSIYDVQRALGVSANDLGTLCKHANINKWARYKPVIYQGFPIRFQSGTPADFAAKTGLNLPTMIAKPSEVAAYVDVEITYEKPTGGLSSPYRLTDFVRYNHYAQKPAEVLWKPGDFMLDKGYSCSVIIYDRSSSAEEAEYISFTDLMNEISGYAGFKNSDKRLCLAVYDNATSDTQPIWYFFSEKFSTVGSSGSWSVSTNMFNSSFTNLLTQGRAYKFLVMLVSNHSYLEGIVSGDRERWTFGVSPSEMTSMESGSNPIQAMTLALENGVDRIVKVLQQASVITQLSYYLDIISAEKYGGNVVVGNYNKLCIQLSMPIITVRSPEELNTSAQYQIRFEYSQGSSSYTIFRPTDGSGNNYYEIESTPSSLQSEIALTPWLRVDDIGGYIGTETDGQGNTIYVYEFDFPNHINTILSQTMPQTQGVNSGLFLFFDQLGSYCNLRFKLYYKKNASQGQQEVRTITVTYNTSQNSGYEHDIEF